MKMPNFENLFKEIQSGCVLITFKKKVIFFKKKKDFHYMKLVFKHFDY